jgi:hypothetical protein
MPPSTRIHPAYLETRLRQEQPLSKWPEEFAIITAFATTGETWTAEQNESADRALEGELQASGLWHFRLTGYSPTTGHAEPGWAVEMPLSDACALGLRYLQDTIYFVSGDELRVILCDEPRDQLFLAVFVREFKVALRQKNLF